MPFSSGRVLSQPHPAIPAKPAIAPVAKLRRVILRICRSTSRSFGSVRVHKSLISHLQLTSVGPDFTGSVTIAAPPWGVSAGETAFGRALATSYPVPSHESCSNRPGSPGRCAQRKTTRIRSSARSARIGPLRTPRAATSASRVARACKSPGRCQRTGPHHHDAGVGNPLSRVEFPCGGRRLDELQIVQNDLDRLAKRSAVRQQLPPLSRKERVSDVEHCR